MNPPRWAFMRRHDIPDLVDPSRIYLRRYRLIECPLFGVFLHKINLPDGDRLLHNHPWAFASFVIRGGYNEQVYNGLWYERHDRRAGRGHRFPLAHFHAIRHLHRTPTWTLVFVGRRRRDWGYLTTTGVVSHEEYHKARGLAA